MTENNFTHAYCDHCRSVQPVIANLLEITQDEFPNSAYSHAMDVTCSTCVHHIATLYIRKQNGN